MSFSVRRVAVIGAGTMGHGIAQAAAMAGWETRLTDSRPGAVPQAIAAIGRNLEGAVTRGKLPPGARDEALGRITEAASIAEASRDADLVIEAVVEEMDAKRRVLRAAAGAAAGGALVASNTSSLSIARLAEELPRPERFLGLHFFNPVHLMKLVEIVVHPGTDAAAREDALTVVRAMGKEPIVVRDSPGFASSRLGVALGLEAMRMVEEGVASPADIDRAMELGYNHPMGPLKLTDLVGLDVRLRIADYLHQTLGSPRFEPPAILRRLVQEGKLGKKTGEGFYRWDGPAS
ncbi:MAG TPA: 3-hydroxyacyl-CoA dehydrogenase family protein [Gemmatimonadales bacterium]|nr:3-hydroxyacyl-CoA dehydrogenase family protein [Gemmatimonadales bacterium]